MEATEIPVHSEIIASSIYAISVERDKVKMFDVFFSPRNEAGMQWRPTHVICGIADSLVKFYSSDGQYLEIELLAGQVIWLDEGIHSGENIDFDMLPDLIIELTNSA